MRKTLEYLGAKPMRYRTRRLLPGDTIVCPAPTARALVASKKFREMRAAADLPPPPASLLAKTEQTASPGNDLTALRAEYMAKVGKRPFHAWTAIQLREKIAAA